MGIRSNGKEKSVRWIGVVLSYNGHTKEIYQVFKNVINNQMEIKAAIAGLKALMKDNLPVEVCSDAAYLVNCINNKWYVNWMNNG